MNSKHINIEIMEHKKTGLLVARSDDLQGFLAHGRDYDDLADNIQSAIKALLEAQGFNVAQVQPMDEKPSAFSPRRQMYNAELVAA